MKQLRVAIAGAGLGGLALAQCLKKQGIKADIFEADASFDARPQGYRIRIDAAGQSALAQALSPELYRLFRATASTSASSGDFLTPGLTASSQAIPDSWQQQSPGQGEPEVAEDLSINRQTLREILLSGIEDSVHFGRKLTGYTLREDGTVAISFEHYPQTRCDLLIGADGVNSRVRKQLAPLAEPQYSGTLCLYGKTSLAQLGEYAAHLQGTNIIFADGFAAILDLMQFDPQAFQPSPDNGSTCRLTLVSDYLYWCFIGPEKRLAVPAQPAALPARLLSLTADWHPAMQQVIRQSRAQDIAVLPIRNGKPQVLWPAGAVTLLGDAIHAMTPAGGLGANSALVDGLELAREIARVQAGESGLVAAIGRYESAMRSRAAAAIAISRRGAGKLFAGSFAQGD